MSELSSASETSGASGTVPQADWLVIIDPQVVFASPENSPWGSPLWAQTVPRIVSLAQAYGPARTVITRFVADPGLGGSWAEYYDDWQFALVDDNDELYAVVPELSGLADHVVTAGTFGKWGPALQAVVGGQPSMAVCGVSTDCCVIATALPAADAGARVQVVADACAGSSPEAHDQAIGAMSMFAPQITIV